MKKPEIDAYGWVNGKYYDDLSEVINPLIDALMTALKDECHILSPESHDQIKTALRDAGVEGL